MAARTGCRSCVVQDLLDLRFHRRRQYRPGDGRAARRFRRCHRAGDAGVSRNRPHRLSGQPIRRRCAPERKSPERSSAQSDARLQSGAGVGAAEQNEGRARRSRLAAKGFGAAIADAVFERDLETIGAVALDHRVSVGASGLGLGLARALVGSAKVRSNAPNAASGAPVGGAAACLAGSCSQATLQQIASAEAAMPVLHLDADQVVAGKDEARRALAWAKERLKQGPILIASSSTPDQVAALQARHGRDAAGHAIEQAMADIAEGLVEAGVRRLVVAGGETSGAVVDSRLSGRGRNRCRGSGVACRRRQGRRDAAGAEVRQFRWSGIFFRCPQADALSASPFRSRTLACHRLGPAAMITPP